MTSKCYFGKMNSILGSVVPFAMFSTQSFTISVIYTIFICIYVIYDITQAPHIGGLAKHGVILEQNYAQPKCAPSRAALMTG